MKKALKYVLYAISFLLIFTFANMGVKYLFAETLDALFSNNDKPKDDSRDLIVRYIKDINKTIPIKIDSVTTLTGMLYAGNVIQYKYKIDDDIIPYIDKDEFKDVCIHNLSMGGGSEFISYVKKEKITFSYAIYDSANKMQFIINISPEDYNKK